MLQCWLHFAAAVPRCAARGTAARGAAASRQPAMQRVANIVRDVTGLSIAKQRIYFKMIYNHKMINLFYPKVGQII